MKSLGPEPAIEGRGGELFRWRRALTSDIPALSAFLRADEERRVGFSGRLLREGLLSPPRLRLPSALRGAVWIADAPREGPERKPSIAGAVLCHPSRLAFPIFPPDESYEGGRGDREFALLASSFSPASVIGMAGDIARYEAALGLTAQSSVEYRLMVLRRSAPRGQLWPLRPALPPGLSLRRAVSADLDALYPLQEAYEREEVLTSIHKLNAAACRAALARALEGQLVFAAEEGGVLVAKAGTNARGFGTDQIGGVYTLPSRRGRGIAAALMAALLRDIVGAGRRPVLFVKPSNRPALSLYRGLGFEDIGDYRADYFEV